MQMEEPSNQRPDFAQTGRECKRLHDEHLARTQEEYRAIPPSQQMRQRKGQKIEGNEEYDYVVDPKHVSGSTQGRGETCRQLRQDRGPTCKQLRHRRQRGTKPIGRRAIGILSILQALITGDFFSESGQVSVAWKKNLQPTDGWCEQYSTYRVARHDHFHHANTRGSRAAMLRIAHFCVPETNVIHASCLVLCRTWHWPPAQNLSHPFHPLLLSFRRSHLCTQALWFSTLIYPAMFHGRVVDQHKSHLSHMFPCRSCRRWWNSWWLCLCFF